MNLEFEWDADKERANIKKHGLDFTTAAHVFSDVNRLEYYDYKHSEDENRYIVIGAINGTLTIVVVVYTLRDSDRIIRIISARPAEKWEEDEYYEHC
jgi:uncharacterized DUF497 family protein